MVNGSVFFHAGGLPIKDEYEYKWTASGFGDSESLEPETLSLKFSCSQPTAEGSTGKIEVEYGNVTNAEYPNIGISKVDRAWHEGTTSYVQESGTFTLTSTSTYDLFSQLIDYHLYDQDDFAIRYCEKGGSMPMQAEFFGTLSGYYVIKQAITAEIYEQEGKWHDDPLGYFIDSIRLTGVPPETFKDMYDNFDPNIKEGGEAFCLTEHEWKGSVDENFIKTMTDNDWSGIFVDVVVEQQGKSDIVKSFKVRSTYTITYK
jgi:hypothetical protein